MSESHEIMLAGLRFRPSLSGALFAPDHGALLVADLHLEQGAALARRGVAVPPYDTGLTLAALEAVIAETAPRILYFLGDSFHDTVGHSLLDDVAFLRIRTIAEATETVWISGNHDPAPKDTLPGRHAAQARIGPVTLRHEPARNPATPEIAGHLHPGAGIVQRGHMVRMLNFCPSMQAVWNAAIPGASTGIDKRERSAERPESLTVFTHTAS